MLLARLSYNNNGWEKPSGLEGKSINPATYECRFGFGFEEWLFNPKNKFLDKITNKVFHYGFIRGLRNYKGEENQPLVLFAINRNNRNRFRVAVIKDWQKVNLQESLQIVQSNNERIIEMRRDLELLELRPESLLEFDNHLILNNNNIQLFNIKFRSFEFFDSVEPYDLDHPVYNYHRFYIRRNI